MNAEAKRAREKNALIVQLRKALKPVFKAASHEDFMHDSWDVNAHVEITLTIGECRAIALALKKTLHPESPAPWGDPEDDCDADD